VKSEVLIEYLVLDSDIITTKEYEEFREQKKMNVFYVDQFDENLWKGYTIIEPTKQMKEYKKVSD